MSSLNLDNLKLTFTLENLQGDVTFVLLKVCLGITLFTTDREFGAWNPGETETNESVGTAHYWKWRSFNGECLNGWNAAGMPSSLCSCFFFLIVELQFTLQFIFHSQTVTRLMTQCNEKGFELEVI